MKLPLMADMYHFANNTGTQGVVMLARLLSVFSFQASARKPESAAYRLGYETAHKDWADNANPYPPGTQEHEDWAEGQFIASTERQW